MPSTPFLKSWMKYVASCSVSMQCNCNHLYVIIHNTWSIMDVRRLLQSEEGWRCRFLLSGLPPTLIFDQEQAATDEMALRCLTHRTSEFIFVPVTWKKLPFWRLAGLRSYLLKSGWLKENVFRAEHYCKRLITGFEGHYKIFRFYTINS